MSKCCLRFITAEISCPQSQTHNNSFRVVISKDSDRWKPLVLIVSRGSFNPLEYSQETLNSVNEFLNEFNLDMFKCDIYLDIMEYLGIHVPYLFRWNVKRKNNYIENNVEEIDINSLNPEEKTF